MACEAIWQRNHKLKTEFTRKNKNNFKSEDDCNNVAYHKKKKAYEAASALATLVVTTIATATATVDSSVVYLILWLILSLMGWVKFVGKKDMIGFGYVTTVPIMMA